MKVELWSSGSLMQDKLTPITSRMKIIKVYTSLSKQVDITSASNILEERKRVALASFLSDSPMIQILIHSQSLMLFQVMIPNSW